VLGGSSPARLAIMVSFLAAFTPSAETSKQPEPHNVAEGPASGKFTLVVFALGSGATLQSP